MVTSILTFINDAWDATTQEVRLQVIRKDFRLDAAPGCDDLHVVHLTELIKEPFAEEALE